MARGIKVNFNTAPFTLYAASGKFFTFGTVLLFPTASLAAPTGLAANGIGTTIMNVNWNSVTSPYFKDYGVYRNGANIAFTTNNTGFTDTGLAPGTTYTYNVTARNVNLIESPLSAPATGQTQSGSTTINLTHNTVATFTGSNLTFNNGFLVWDHGQDGPGASNALWAFKRPTGITPAQYNLQNVASPSTDPALTTITSPYPRIQNFLRGSCYSDVGGNSTRVVQISRQLVNRPAWPYYSNWQYQGRFDPKWAFAVPNGANIGAPDDNMKTFVYTEGNGGPFGDGSATQPFMYWGMNNQTGGIANNTSVSNSGDWIQQTFPSGTTQWANPDQNNHNNFFGGVPNPTNPANGWIDVKIVAKWTPDNTGYFRIYYNDGLSINYAGPTVFSTAFTTVNECIGLPYTRDYGLNSGSPPPTPQNAVYMADILYFNGATGGRVILCSSPVYTTPGATRVTQIPVSGNATSYTCTVNAAGFAAGTQVYPFYVDESTSTVQALNTGFTFIIQG